MLGKNYSCDQIKKNVMGRVCGMDGGGERSLQGFVMEPEGNTQFGIQYLELEG